MARRTVFVPYQPKTVFNKGKRADHCAVIAEPPFFAIDCRLDTMKFPSPCLTLGGLKVDGLSAQVRRADGSAIEGLFAAGRNAAGVCARSYVSGLSLADCVFSGRRAGRSVSRAEHQAGQPAAADREEPADAVG